MTFEEILEEVRNHVWTQKERLAQLKSFAYGNGLLANGEITHEDIDKACEELGLDK